MGPMAMADPEITAALGEIKGQLSGITSKVDESAADIRTIAEKAAEVRHETTVAFGHVESTMSALATKLEGHVADDERRFGEQAQDIRDVSQKVDQCALAHHSKPGVGVAPAPAEGGLSTGVKAAIGSFIAGLGALGTWFTMHLGGDGP